MCYRNPEPRDSPSALPSCGGDLRVVEKAWAALRRLQLHCPSVGKEGRVDLVPSAGSKVGKNILVLPSGVLARASNSSSRSH